MHQVLLAGQWRDAKSSGTIRAQNPATGETLPDEFPISTWEDLDRSLSAANEAADALRQTSPEQIAAFLRRFAERIETKSAELVAMANLETALPKSPRLADVELPRTTTQLRQGADAALEGSWALPTIDSKANIRSIFAPIGPVIIFGPNNFPFAFNAISGGDFAAAIASGNPVIAKAHPSHPGTTRLLAIEAAHALAETKLHPAAVQMLYHLSNSDGLRWVADERVGAIAFTGSRKGGLALKTAADAAGKPIYLEMSSVNPIVFLPGALQERAGKLVDELAGSCLMASGQFCTSPGFNILFAGAAADAFVAAMKAKFEAAPSQSLLSSVVANSLLQGVQSLVRAGAKLITGGKAIEGSACKFANTILQIDGQQFLGSPKALQAEAFGNATLFVLVKDVAEAAEVIDHLEGNLTGAIYSAGEGDADAPAYAQLAPRLRKRVGRLLNDKMPTGVALSPAMNHGGPFPSTGHPGFTAVGIPASLRRFAGLQCYDGVRPDRLPAALSNRNPTGKIWRSIDGQWSRGDVGA